MGVSMAMLKSQHADPAPADPVKQHLAREPPVDGTVDAVAKVGICLAIEADQLDYLRAIRVAQEEVEQDGPAQFFQ